MFTHAGAEYYSDEFTAPEIPTDPAPNLGRHTRPILQELLD